MTNDKTVLQPRENSVGWKEGTQLSSINTFRVTVDEGRNYSQSGKISRQRIMA